MSLEFDGMKDFDVEGLALSIAGMYLGGYVMSYFRRYMKKQLKFKRNMTFSGAVVYANRMEE